MDDKELTVLIGSNISRFRKMRDITQSTLAEKLGISESYMSRVERGVKRLKLASIVDTAEILGVSFDALLGRESETNHAENLQRILSEKPNGYWEPIEEMVRICEKYFDLKSDPKNGSKGNDE